MGDSRSETKADGRKNCYKIRDGQGNYIPAAAAAGEVSGGRMLLRAQAQRPYQASQRRGELRGARMPLRNPLRLVGA